MRVGGIHCAFCVSVLLAVVGGAGATWSKLATTNALVDVTANIARPAASASRVLIQDGADGTYRVAVKIPDDCHVDFDCDVTLTVLPNTNAGWHANLEYPFKFRPSTNARTLARASIDSGRIDRPADGTETIHVVVHARTPGVLAIDGVLKLGVCTTEWCRNANETIAISLPVS